MSKRRGKKKGGKSIFDKLTDTSQYTGSHKNRFNADGTGRGAAGRDLGKMGGGTGGGWHGERFKSAAASPPKRSGGGVKKTAVKKKRVVRKKKTTTGSGGGVKKTTGTKRKKKSSGGGSIFDRLTDSSQYTGSHKNRFNADGTGRGASGRDLGKSGGGTHGNYGW